MELTWSLSELYTGVDSPEFSKDFDELTTELKKMSEWVQTNLSEPTNPTKKLEEYIMLKNRLSRFDNLFVYTDLAITTDATNEQLTKWIDKLEELSVDYTNQDVLVKQFLNQIKDLPAVISSSPLLLEHEFVLAEMQDESRYMLSEAEELIIAKMEMTGSSLWQKLWEHLTSVLMIDITIDGEKKTLPLSEIRTLAHAHDADLRKNAYTCELYAYSRIDTACAFSLNGIKGEVLTTSKMRGYESPLQMTLQQSRMDKQTLDAMFAAITDHLPTFEAYFLHKAKLLGAKEGEGLPFYNLFAPIGKMEVSYTVDESKKYVVSAFSSFSEKMGAFAAHAFDNQWIDFMPREGKRGGAFCENLHNLKQSRVLTNFSDSFESIVTIAHELGHAYHNSCLHGQTPFNNSCSMPIAETASTFSECILTKHVLQQSTSDTISMQILENDIQGLAQTVVDIYSRFLFEDEVFARRGDGSLSVAELKTIMTDAQKKAYGCGLDPAAMHPYMWCCKPHYYDAGYNYYNFPYAFGSLLSRGLYALYREDKEKFVPLYDQMLTVSGKSNLYDTAKMCGIDIHDKAFWNKSLALVKEDIDTFISHK